MNAAQSKSRIAGGSLQPITFYFPKVALAAGLFILASVTFHASEAIIVERGPHHRVVSLVNTVTNQEGAIESVAGRYIELRNGMHYFEDNQWKESRDVIKPFPKGALAKQGLIKAIFAANLNSLAAIDLLAPDGQRLRLSVLGLGYYDHASGQSVVLTEVKDRAGRLLPPNKVIYANAFSSLKADLVLTYQSGRFESDVILRENPPSPARYGLDPEATDLEILTEIIEAPQPRIVEQVIDQDDGAADQFLDFGALQMGPGQAFSTAKKRSGSQSQNSEGILIRKTWQKIGGRQVLIEAVRYRQIRPWLQELPSAPATARIRTSQAPTLARSLPPPRTSGAPAPMLLAALEAEPAPGVVLDYVLVAGGHNFTFKKNETYWVRPSPSDPNYPGGFYVSGLTTFEPNAVIKYNRNSFLAIYAGGGVSFPTAGPYVVFTSANDYEQGQPLNGLTPQPTDRYAGKALWFYYATASGYTISRARFIYAQSAIEMMHYSSAWPHYSLTDSRFDHCDYGVKTIDSYCSVDLGNLYFSDVQNRYGIDPNVFHLVGEVRVDPDTFPVPTITMEPSDQTNNYGATVNFSVSATGFCPRYQWFRNGVSTGVTSPSLTVGAYYSQSGKYHVVVANDFGFVTSRRANLTLTNGPPNISMQPQPRSQAYRVGASATLAGAAIGSEPMSYQWLHDNIPINNGTAPDGTSFSGATTFELTINNLQPGSAGNYTFQASNPYGSVIAYQPAVITVNTQPFDYVYTSSADFTNRGILVNLNAKTVGHQLQLNATPTPLPFVYMACSGGSGGGLPEPGRGTMVKIDANSGQVVGEYRTSPMIDNYPYGFIDPSPSRTTVDRYGNVWVANRQDTWNCWDPILEEYRDMGSVMRLGCIMGGIRVRKNPDGSLSPDPNGDYLKPPFVYNTCPDRNGTSQNDPPDGLIATSRRLTDIKPWENNQGVDTCGGVFTACDEAITAYVRVLPSGTRTIAVDKNNNIWVGGSDRINDNYHDAKHELLNGITGERIPGSQLYRRDQYGPENLGGYGGLVDTYGTLWSAAGYRDVLGLLRLVPNPINQMPPPGLSTRAGLDGNGLQKGNYGLAIDPNTQTIMHVSSQEGIVYEMASDGTLGRSFNIYPQHDQYSSQEYYNVKAQGLVVDSRGNIWVARSVNKGRSIAHLRCSDGLFLGNARLDSVEPPDPGPTGVAVDNSGKIWTANYGNNTAMRINPNTGFAGQDRPIGAVDLVVDLGDGSFHQNPYNKPANPYNHSDMTGFITLAATYPCGFWDFVEDGGFDNLHWQFMGWTSSDDPHVTVEARAANSTTVLPSASFITVKKNQIISNLTGRYVEVRVTINRPFNLPTSPILYDFTLTGPTL